ncbi:hypothetical protein Q7P35_004535 [Cladosporium inversicolor]
MSRCRQNFDDASKASTCKLTLYEWRCPKGIDLTNTAEPLVGQLLDLHKVTSASTCQRKHILRPVAAFVWCKLVQAISISCLLLYLPFRPPRGAGISKADKSYTSATALELTEHLIRLIETTLRSLLRLLTSTLTGTASAYTMATPSNIPNHPLVQMLDYQGDAFPSGSSYYIKNSCSNFSQALAFNHSVPGAVTCTAQPDPDCKWLIQYENNDRSRVALKSARNGRYLAATSADCRAPMGLSDQMVWWFVYQGGAPGTYWLSTSQTKDCFLHTWNCEQNEGSLVASFTNRDRNPEWRDYYNAPYSMFEQWTTGMSWGLDPTPELMQWKEQQTASPQAQSSQQGSDELRKREQELSDKEKQLQLREAELQQKAHDRDERERNLKDKEEAFEKRSREFEKSYEELKKREEAVQTAEERVKKSKKGGKADLLSIQEERDKLQAYLKNAQDQLGAANEQIAKLKQYNQQYKQASSQTPVKTGSLVFSIRSPEPLAPSRKLPDTKTPERKTLNVKRPGQSLPSGYNTSMTKRFEAGRRAMSTKA